MRDLIKASNLTRRAFAARIGLDESKLSKSLSGTRRFSSVDLARIAETCDVTVDWLLTGDTPAVSMAARASGGSARSALEAATRFSATRADLATLGYSQQWRTPPSRRVANRYADEGRDLAHWATEVCGESGPPATTKDLSSLVEAVFGADVAVVDLDSDFDGLAVSSANVKLIVLATSPLPSRQRFTLAHELGHLLAGDDQDIHLDRDVFDRAQTRDPGEARANAFASAFLMPEAALRSAVQAGITEAAFASLACDLVVSPSALAYRLLHLRFIDAGTCDRYKTITAAKAAHMAGRGDEFARQVAASSTTRLPGLLVQDAYAAYEAGKTTLRPYANLLGVNVDVLRDSIEANTVVDGAS
ncbi:XRE family transcriptional regulator [Actinokineospora bangkokensis]|uniref:HTH cro/C1-type domain-containing protein n=1 Tax=Actinokineospora bangkokensis TaxID=1193682 RepID=A0A1Q9LD15_9PSEU|nr:XRE family transcriptional regulator [Actinokineospora bangkokensis]OLR89930.1 hypothetical protein BJP25_02760 [Actinokineospora bangkokensis]